MSLSDYAKYKKLTIDSSKIDSDLSHFPVPIPLGSAVGLTDADVTDIFTEVGSSYLKTAVFMADETTQLYVEVEQWDSVNNKGLLWVSRDTWSIASASDTDIYLAFDATAADNTAYVGTPGSRTEVWDSGFAARYGMSQDPTGGAGCIKDSTSNANHATPGGSMASGDLVDGQIGKALDFDGIDDYLSAPANTSLDITSANGLTFQATVYPTGGSGSGNLLARDESEDREYVIRSKSLAPTLEIGGTEEAIANTGLSLNAYNNLGLTFKTGNISWYLDGNTDGTDTTSKEITASDNALQIGRRNYSGYYEHYQGLICEARLLSAVKSADWFKADYHAQTDNLLTFATHEISGTVSEDGSYVSRTVRLHKRSDGSLVDEVVSSSIDGTFSFGLHDGTTEYYVVALDDMSDATDYNALIYDRVTGVAI